MGVKATQINEAADRTPRMEVIFRRSGFSTLITARIAIKKIAKAKLINIRAKENKTNETVLELPKDSVLPRSLKKFRKNEYPEVFGSIRVPPA